MKTLGLWIAATALCLAACGQQQQPEEPEAAGAETPVVEAEPAVEEATTEKAAAMVDDAFIDHMHAHAEHVDELMFALADGDLMEAMTPAYWLSRHETVPGIPDEWQQHVAGMRAAALEVGAAEDLDTARAAAEKITASCQACHSAAGVKAL